MSGANSGNDSDVEARGDSMGEDSTVDTDLDEGAMDGAAAATPYPSDEYLLLVDGLHQLRLTNYAVQPLITCLQAAGSILKHGPRMRPTDLDGVRRLFRDELVQGCEKCFKDERFLRCISGQQVPMLFEAALQLVEVAQIALAYRGQQGACDLWVDLDQDLATLLTCLVWVLSKDTAFHRFCYVEPLPSPYTPYPADKQAAEQLFGPAATHQGDDGDEVDEEQQEFEWVTHLVNTFMLNGGIRHLLALFNSPEGVSLLLLSTGMFLLKTIVFSLNSHYQQEVQKIIVAKIKFLESLATSPDERLTDNGTDRTYSRIHFLIYHTYDLLQTTSSLKCADTMVAPAQREFILRMLASSSFNKVLSGVRECHDLLVRSRKLDMQQQGQELNGPGPLEDTVNWMEQKEIVQRMLRANLHQRQYVEQVTAILNILTQEGMLTNKHVEMMWALTEQEDTYEAVKTNVYDMLAQVASHFSSDQLDMLFSKFQPNKERSLLDTLKLAELLKRLAASDLEGSMAPKILDMLWLLAMPAGAPPELLLVIVEVIALYNKTNAGIRGVMLNKCIEIQRASQEPDVNSLRLLVELIKQEVTEEEHKNSIIEDQSSQGIIHTVVLKICNMVAAALPGLQQVAAFQHQHGGPSLAAAAAAAATAGLDLSMTAEGIKHFEDTLAQYISALTFMAERATIYFLDHLAIKLWVKGVKKLSGLPMQAIVVRFFSDGVKHKKMPPFLEETAQKTLLEGHITAEDAACLSVDMYRLFFQYFTQVNHHMKKLIKGRPIVAQDSELIGLDFLWDVFLSNVSETVVSHAQDMLLEVYLSCNQGRPRFKAEMVKRIVSNMAKHQGQLSAGNKASIRAVVRILVIARKALENKEHTMPPMPAHSLSWRGSPVTFDLQFQGQGRMREVCHTNEYVGMLRIRVGQQLAVSPKSIRLFNAGQEFKNDALTIGELGIQAGSRHVLSGTISPQENDYTKLAGEYWQEWEHGSLTWMLSRQEGLYPLLFHLVDHPEVPELRSQALYLLQIMPTCPDLPKQLQDAVLCPQRQQALLQLLCCQSFGSNAAEGGLGTAVVERPYQMLYTLQALCALLFPAYDDAAVVGVVDGEQMADAEGSTAGVSPSSSPRPVSSSAQLHQMRQDFLDCGCLEVVCSIVRKIMSSCSTDLQLLRQLGQLLVVLIHNILDVVVTAGSTAAAAGAVEPPGSGSDNAAAGVTAMELSRQSEIEPTSRRLGQGDSVVQQVAPSILSAAAAALAAGAKAAAAAPGGGGGTATEPPSVTVVPPNSSSPEAASSTPPLTPVGSKQQRDRRAPLSQQQQHLPSPEGPESMMVDLPMASSTAQLLVETLVKLAIDSGQAWYSEGNALHDDDGNDDVTVTREALQLVLRLVELQPVLLGHLLSASKLASSLVTELLLNRHYSAVRRQAKDVLVHLSSGTHQVRVTTWLMQQLYEAREAAEQQPGVCGEFYSLFCTIVSNLGSTGFPKEAVQLAEHLLQDEVSVLQQLRPAGGEEGNTALQGRLELLLSLVQTLDRRSVGCEREAGLISLLLRAYLFPEAVLKLAVLNNDLILSSCAATLQARCHTQLCRKAAFELLQELMRDSAVSLEEGVHILEQLHLQEREIVMRYAAGNQARPMRPIDGYMGLRNAGATCYMNAVLQQLYMQPCIRQLVLAAAAVTPAEAVDNVFAQLQAVFANLALGKPSSYSPEAFWHSFKDYDGCPIDVREHQDAYEFFTRLQDFVDQHLISTHQVPAIQRVMGGRFAQQIICRGHNFKSEREEDFYQISVDVRGMGSLEKSLETYVQGELLEGDNAYFCEELGQRVNAVKRTCIKKLPHTLCIHLKRFEFDFHTQTRYKVRDRFEFPLELDMTKFTADGLAALEQQQQEQQQQNSSGGGSTTNSGHWASSSGGLQHTSSDAAQQALHMYDLMGVVVHTGSAFTGHYYSYIRERGQWQANGSCQAGCWLCFDDQSVKPWDPSNLDCDCYGGRAAKDVDGGGKQVVHERPHSAYMLFYERRCEWNLDADALQAAKATTNAPAAVAVGHDGGAKGAAAAKTGAAEGVAADGDDPMDAGTSGEGEGLASPAGAVSIAGFQQTATWGAAAAAPCSSSSPGGRGDEVGPSSSAAAAAEQAFVPPYRLPISLYRHVMTENINFMWNQHVYDKEYFRFMRQLVNRGECSQMVSRKSRKKDMLPTSISPGRKPPAAPGEQPPAAGGGLESMEVAPSEAATGPAEEQQQGQPGEVLDTAAAAPGPSGSRRLEEQELVAQCLTRVGLLFQFQVYHLAHNNLKSDASIWLEALKSLMVSNQLCLLVALKLFISHPVWVNTYLGWDAPEDTMNYFEHLLGWVLEQTSQRCFSPQGGGTLLMQPLLDLLIKVLVPVLQAAVEDNMHCSVQAIDIVRVLADFSKCGSGQMGIVVSHTGSVRLLAQAISNFVESPEREDGLRDLLSMYRILDEWTSSFTNLSAMAAEWNNMQGEVLPNPFVGLEEGGLQGATVNDQTFRALMDSSVLSGLFLTPRAMLNPACHRLACRLAFGNMRASYEAIGQVLSTFSNAYNISYKTVDKLVDNLERFLRLQDGFEDQRVEFFLTANNTRLQGFLMITAVTASSNQPRTEDRAFFCGLLVSKLLGSSHMARVVAVHSFQFFGQCMHQLALHLASHWRDEPELIPFFQMYGRDVQ